MRTIVKTELLKLKRYHIIWAGIALMLLSVLLTLFTSMANDGSVWDFRYLIEQVIKNNMSMIFPMCIALIAGYIISREEKDDVLKNIITIPISLIGYWYVTAQNKKIIFKTDICIPMIMPFKGADLSLILGYLLENAVEAAEKVEENKYINVKMKFDKNNLLLFVDNSYKGKLLKTRDNRLKSTKSDAENHGVGLASVYRAVAKYHGSVVIEDSEPGKFKIRIVLYSNVQE